MDRREKRTTGNSRREDAGQRSRRTKHPEERAAFRQGTENERRSAQRTARRPETGRKRRPGEDTVHRKETGPEKSRKNRMANERTEANSGASGERRRKVQKKRATFNIVSGVVLIAAVCVFVFSLYQLVTMLVPYYSGGKEYDRIKDIAVTADEDGSGYSVDFDALLKENPDTVAWIRFNEPAIINYPVVKSADNVEYLTKTFTANDNKLGAIFMDMRNKTDFSDRNTFIYGHHLNVGGEMFSELLQYKDESFCKKNPDFYIYTPDGRVRTYRVFSAGVVKDTAENYKMEYASDQEFEEYLKVCRESSNYQVDVELNAQSQIVSLSTCTNIRDDERFLVQGVLTAVD